MKLPATLIVLSLLLLLCAACGGDGRTPAADSAPLEDVLTLELSFGDTDLPDEYLLARPRGLAVNEAGNILVVDEDRVKVFNPEGQPLIIVGRPGDGPGEFRDSRRIYMSPSGHFTIFGGMFGNTASFFDQSYSYLSQRNLRRDRPFEHILEERGLIQDGPTDVYNLSDDCLLYAIDTNNKDRSNEYDAGSLLFYETPDTLALIAYYPYSNVVFAEGGFSSIWYTLGEMLFAPLPENRVVYFHTFHDSKISGDTSTFTLTILSLDTFEREQITHLYDPVELEYTPISYDNPSPQQQKRADAMNRAKEKIIEERKYKAALFTLKTDGNYIFCTTHMSNDSLGRLTHVFDSRSMQWVSSAYLSGWVYRNGFAYSIEQPEDAFPRVEKYRIDPAVYGK